MTSSPFFIVGIGRSGTTLLRLMLHHHPRIAIPYESGFVTSYYEQRETYGDLCDEANSRKLIGDILREPTLKMWDHAFEVDRILAAAAERTVPGIIAAIYSEYAAAKGKPRWGDKSDYLDRMHVLHEMFPTSQFIHIIRDGRDVAQSVLKLPWGPDDIVRAAEWWNEHVWVARRVGTVLGPSRYLEVRYEHLVEHAERELRRCCAFLGEAYSTQMLAYTDGTDQAIPSERRGQHYNVNKPPDRSRVAAWKREMNRYDVAIFNKHARRMLLELGYEIPDAPLNKAALGLRYLTILGRRLQSRLTT
jgi:hypothetical protein